MNRKGWDNLSSTYRRRLERRGITREAYARGDSLTRARGHFTPRPANVRRNPVQMLRYIREQQEARDWNTYRFRVRRLQAGESIRRAFLIDGTIRGGQALRQTVEFYESLEAQYDEEGEDGADYHGEWSDWYEAMAAQFGADWLYPELEMYYHGNRKG